MNKGKHIHNSIPDLIERYNVNISKELVHWRMKHFEWDVEKAIKTPKMKAGRKKNRKTFL